MSSQSANPVQRLLTEDVLTLQEARREIASVTGRRVDKTTIYRWVLRGVRGTKLEHIRLGDRILTSKQALTRFINARTK
jgi:hypothetical protein